MERQQRSDAKDPLDDRFNADNKGRDPWQVRPGSKFEIQRRRESPVQEKPNPKKNANRDVIAKAGKDSGLVKKGTGSDIYVSEKNPNIRTPRIVNPRLNLPGGDKSLEKSKPKPPRNVVAKERANAIKNLKDIKPSKKEIRDIKLMNINEETRKKGKK